MNSVEFEYGTYFANSAIIEILMRHVSPYTI
jgi:hypothetical protein